MFCFIVKMKRKASDSKDYYVINDSESKESSFSVHQRDPLADPIILSDSEKVNQEIDLENDDKFDMAFDALLDEELKQMTWNMLMVFVTLCLSRKETLFLNGLRVRKTTIMSERKC